MTKSVGREIESGKRNRQGQCIIIICPADGMGEGGGMKEEQI